MTEPTAPRAQRRLPSVFYNFATLIGAWIAGVALLVILFMMGVEATSHEHSPYTGILTFVVLPAILLVGLVLMAWGARREHHRRQRGNGESKRDEKIDANEHAALTIVTSMILNLDETLTRG